MQFRSLFYGLWLGPLVGVICGELTKPLFFANYSLFELQPLVRSVGIVYLVAAAIGYPLFLMLVRYDKLHFVGFTCAGVIAGLGVYTLGFIGHRVFNWLPYDDGIFAVYVFDSVVVAWAVWAVSRLAEFINILRNTGS